MGLAFALFGVGMTIVTGDPVWDGIGTVAIGVLLGIIAIVLMVEMKSLLIGEGATATQEQAILDALAGTDDVERVIHCRTQYLGPEELLVAAKIAITPSAELPRVAATIDAAERRVRAAVPIAQVIYLEPDLDRSAANS
ncbi:cation transporter, permease component [Mycobacteroides abscessus subsp. massiliense]|nr:cation transporter, permease component [Mycobacteroides abscessus subsp. massiliense]